jgi:hypothetical protein
VKSTLLFALLFSFTAVQPGALLWRDPGHIEARDLYWGSGAEARLPKPPFTFIEEKLTGTVAKVVVKDANGTIWDVKLAGEESHPEVAANRLVWALGYPVQEMYFVHEGRIDGAHDLKRAKEYIKADGSFVAARFRRRDANVSEAEGWAFSTNPFKDARELSGLIILMAMINNWDTDDTKNQEVLVVKTPEGVVERWYAATDLGASFGRFKGPQGTPIKWTLSEYEKDPLVAGVQGETLVLDYQAYGTPVTRVPLEHARWFASLVGRLSEEQVRSAFKAAGASAREIEGYTRKFMAKAAELRNAVVTTHR